MIGVALVATAVAVALLIVRPQPLPAEPAAVTVTQQTSVELPASRVATILRVDAGAGAAGLARPGDHVDILGYFSRQVTGGDGVTRRLLEDVPILGVAREGRTTALTLAVPHEGALLLQQAQALGGQPFVVLRAAGSPAGGAPAPSAFSDSDLVRRASETLHSAAASYDR